MGLILNSILAKGNRKPSRSITTSLLNTFLQKNKPNKPDFGLTLARAALDPILTNRPTQPGLGSIIGKTLLEPILTSRPAQPSLGSIVGQTLLEPILTSRPAQPSLGSIVGQTLLAPILAKQSQPSAYTSRRNLNPIVSQTSANHSSKSMTTIQKISTDIPVQTLSCELQNAVGENAPLEQIVEEELASASQNEEQVETLKIQKSASSADIQLAVIQMQHLIHKQISLTENNSSNTKPDLRPIQELTNTLAKELNSSGNLKQKKKKAEAFCHEATRQINNLTVHWEHESSWAPFFKNLLTCIVLIGFYSFSHRLLTGRYAFFDEEHRVSDDHPATKFNPAFSG